MKRKNKTIMFVIILLLICATQANTLAQGSYTIKELFRQGTKIDGKESEAKLEAIKDFNAKFLLPFQETGDSLPTFVLINVLDTLSFIEYSTFNGDLNVPHRAIFNKQKKEVIFLYEYRYETIDEPDIEKVNLIESYNLKGELTHSYIINHLNHQIYSISAYNITEANCLSKVIGFNPKILEYNPGVVFTKIQRNFANMTLAELVTTMEKLKLELKRSESPMQPCSRENLQRR